MARVSYTSTTPNGNTVAKGVDLLIRGRAEIERTYAAMDAARGNPADYSKLEGGDFGAAAGQGQALWDTVASIRNLLSTADVGGLGNFLADLDKGG